MLTLILLLVPVIKVQGCLPTCKQFVYKSHQLRREFISHLPDSLKIRELALVGTRHSASYNTYATNYKTQDLSISAQLNYGVRVLDVGIRVIKNRFAVHMKDVYLDLMFGKGVLAKVHNFLKVNRREIVMILLYHDHYSGSDVTLSYCAILNHYRSLEIGSRIVTNWTLDDNIGMHRGKILVGNLDVLFSKCTMNINDNCKVQYTRLSSKSSSPIYEKWAHVRRLHDQSFSNDSGSCFINFLPEKKIHLYKGILNRDLAVDGFYRSESGCQIPINYRMASYFEHPRRSLMIVIADFVIQELIDRIIGSNFEKEYLLAKISGSAFPLPDDVFGYLEFRTAEA